MKGVRSPHRPQHPVDHQRPPGQCLHRGLLLHEAGGYPDQELAGVQVNDNGTLILGH